MNFATKNKCIRILVWLIWFITLLVFSQPGNGITNWLTSRQQHYQVGALPVLYALLETLQVRPIINRHCPTRGEVGHGTVAVILILNRLMFPLPLYQVADWVGRTTLVAVLGVPAQKFNSLP